MSSERSTFHVESSSIMDNARLANEITKRKGESSENEV